MDIQELFIYKMSDDEKEKWETLKTDMYLKFCHVIKGSISKGIFASVIMTVLCLPLQYRFDMKLGVSELAKLLWQIKDAYWSYVVGVTLYAKKTPERMKTVIEYVKSHMDATTSDIVWFISNQPDFHDDAAPCYEGDEDV